MRSDDRSTPALAAATAMVEELARAGVRHVCIAPGARSGPLTLATALHPTLRDWMVVDERSAGFFALGMARQLGAPVAVLCTSGTAAANLLPAVVEASLSEVPLIVLTADRPPELRDCAAPQTIDQVRIYGSHVRWATDLPAPSADVDLDAYYRRIVCRAVATAMESRRGPVHVNVPFREPLLPEGGMPVRASEVSEVPPAMVVPSAVPQLDERTAHALAAALGREERGLVLCGPRAGLEGQGALVRDLAARLGWPILADPLSGVRFGGCDAVPQIDTYDVLLRDRRFCDEHVPRAVLQLGAPPVSKALGQYLAAHSLSAHVVVASPGTWPDPTHAATTLVHAEGVATVRALCAGLPPSVMETEWAHAWQNAGHHARTVLDERLAAESTLFEGKIAAEVVARLPADAVLHVGNSMPVRDLDMFGRARPAELRVDGNRGANGIDGVLSSALGAAAVSGRPTLLVVGDLSFLHDLGGLQIAARHALNAVVIVVNNDGGGVFSFLPFADDSDVFERCFATPHGLDLASAVTLGRGRHHRVRDWRSFGEVVDGALVTPGLDVIEVPSDRDVNARLHREYVAAVHAGLPGLNGVPTRSDVA